MTTDARSSRSLSQQSTLPVSANWSTPRPQVTPAAAAGPLVRCRVKLPKSVCYCGELASDVEADEQPLSCVSHAANCPYSSYTLT